MKEISEEEMADAIKFAHEAIKVQCAAQVALAEAAGKKETREYEGEREDEELAQKIPIQETANIIASNAILRNISGINKPIGGLL